MPPTPPPRPPLGTVRRPRQPAAQPPAGGLPPGFPTRGQGLPLMAGEVILTPMEEEALKKVGWKKGDPIPADMANLHAAAAAARADADTLPPVNAEGYRPLEVPQAIDISQLSRDRQAELTRALENAKLQVQAYDRQRASQVDGAGPGINEAITAGLTEPLGRPNVEALPQSAPPAQAAEPDDGAGGAAALKECPNCGHDLLRPHPAEATVDDKLRWLVAQEGGLRFEKDYTLYGGRVVVTFRSLTAAEADMAFRQIAVDGTRSVRASVPEPEDTYWRNLLTYRLVMGLARIWTPTQGPQLNPPVAEWEVEAGAYVAPNTKVSAILGPITEAMFPTENVRRVIGAAFHEFQLLVERMEANAANDSFWNGIGPQS